MEIKTKDELFQVIKDLQAKNSEITERLDSMATPPTDPETPKKDDEKKERTPEEIDEIANLLKE
ncbi:MAG: hypothetical protein GX790_10385 [Syntrophomonadaceae bacterium]|nr:hypothetical protein [Syntrophomonadaceae bacterium]